MIYRSVVAMTGVAISVFTLAGATAVGSAIDFLIAQDGSDDHRLVIGRPSEVSEPYELPLIATGVLAGHFASIEPGWDGLGVDQPDQSHFALIGSNGVALVRMRFDRGFVMFDESGTAILASDGASHIFAGPPEGASATWHEHLIFAVEPGAAANSTYSATFRLTDQQGQQADSDEFTLIFRTTATAGCGAMGGVCGAVGTLGLGAAMLGLACLHRRKKGQPVGAAPGGPVISGGRTRKDDLSGTTGN